MHMKNINHLEVWRGFAAVGAVVVFGLAVRHFPKGALVKESDFEVVGNSVASFSRDLIRTCFCMFDTDPTYPHITKRILQSAFQDTNKTCLDSECIKPANIPSKSNLRLALQSLIVLRHDQRPDSQPSIICPKGSC